MSVAATSIVNYHAHRDSGRAGTQAGTLLALMAPGRMYSRSELADAAGMRLSSVCGRVNELLALGLLVEGRARPCLVTGRTVTPVGLRVTP